MMPLIVIATGVQVIGVDHVEVNGGDKNQALQKKKNLYKELFFFRLKEKILN